jgi:hypothetical protein
MTPLLNQSRNDKLQQGYCQQDDATPRRAYQFEVVFMSTSGFV